VTKIRSAMLAPIREVWWGGPQTKNLGTARRQGSSLQGVLHHGGCDPNLCAY